MAKSKKSRSFGAQMVRFRHALAQIKENAQDFSGFDAEIKAFEQAIEGIEKLNEEQEALKAKLHEATERFYEEMGGLEKQYSALKRVWQAKYGVNTAKAKAFEPGEGMVHHAEPHNSND